MRESRQGRDPRQDPGSDGVDQALEELRLTSLRYIVLITATVHFAWSTLLTATSPYEVGVKAWLLFPLVAGGELATYRLLSQGHRVAGRFFAVWGLAAATAGIWLFQAPEAFFLYPLLALATAVVLGPLSGFLVVAGETVLAALLLAVTPSGAFDPGQVGLAVMAAALTVAIAWTLLHSLVTAVHWSLVSYEQARRNAREAQEHRGKLVQALAQLDTAYYRLQRANAALAEAWRRAENAERAKGEFVANISHELRTPLNLIIGFSEMMISAPETYGAQPLPREYRGDLNAIYRSAQHLLALTNDVLDLAQAEAHRLALVAEPADLGEVVADTVDIVREYVEAKGLRLCVHIADGLPRLHLDRLRIRQVLLNLLTNAARFTDHGGISVDVSMDVTTRDDEVMVSVADTGRGIPPDRVGQIFEDFQHVDDSAAREHLSTGLGLAISKRFVELHRGRMTVESELGVGTTFQFALPVGGRPAAGAEVARPQGGAARAQAAERILVLAHEEPSLRYIFQRRLGGYRTVWAPDLEQATRLAGELKATAIVVDAAADGASGQAAVIRCPLPHKSQLRRALGVADYLVKPVGRAELHAVIDRLGLTLRRVLVADDDLRVVRLLTRMIKAAGHGCEVLAAYNGDEALATMREARPDLVFLDLMMPGRSGQDVLEAMAGEPDLAAIPVVVVSAIGPDEEKIPLLGEVTLRKAEGLQMTELLDLVEAILGSLRPPRAYLTAREPEPAEARPD